MQWTPEHVQWAEQHFDITSSSSRSPAHKAEGYRTQRVAMASSMATAASGYQYSWANDDISALTASNLLKKYAQKYSGLLDMPLIYPEAPAALATPNTLTNGRKAEVEAWVEPGGVYPMGCEVGVSAGKGGVVSSDVCSSPGAEPGFTRGSCPGQSLAPQEAYPPPAAYGPYLHPSSSGAYGTHPSPLLQGTPAPPPASAPPHPPLVPPYSAPSSPPLLPTYSYTPSPYAPVAPGYSPPPPPPPPSSYLPAAIAAPTPLPPPSSMPSYPSYAPPAPLTPTPLSGCSSGPLKRKAFYLGGQVEMGGESYAEFGYAQPQHPPSSSSSASLTPPLYRLPPGSAPNANANANGTFKPANQASPCEDPRGGGGGFGGGSLTSANQASPSLTSPGFQGSANTGDSAFSFGSPTATTNAATNGSPVATSSSSSSSSSCSSVAMEESLKAVSPRVLELVSSRVLVSSQLPLVEWGEVAGLEGPKEALEEEVLWPLLRPDVFSPLGGANAPVLPRALLLYGPPGCGRSLLARCLAGHMGAPLLHLHCPLLTNDWAPEAEQVLQACFLLARARQPCVLLLSALEAVMGTQSATSSSASSTSSSSSSSSLARVRRELQTQLDRLLLGGCGGRVVAGGVSDPPPQVLLLATTSRPAELEESAVRRYFSRRVLVPPPDPPARRRLLDQNLLAPLSHMGAPLGLSLGPEELDALARRTEGYSARTLTRLCQHALQGAAESLDMMPAHTHSHSHAHTHMHTLAYQHLESALLRSQPDVTPTDMDAYVEWGKTLGCRQ